MPESSTSVKKQVSKTPENTNNQSVKNNRGRRRSKEVIGFTSCHEEVIHSLIDLYKKGAMNQDFITGQVSLARFIHAKEILLQKTPEGYKPLKLTSITTLVNIAYKEIANDEERLPKTK